MNVTKFGDVSLHKQLCVRASFPPPSLNVPSPTAFGVGLLSLSPQLPFRWDGVPAAHMPPTGAAVLRDRMPACLRVPGTELDAVGTAGSTGYPGD